jgi:hypothetical protein
MLRSAGPVVQVRFPIIGKVWITTTQELAGRMLKDSQTFTLRIAYKRAYCLLIPWPGGLPPGLFFLLALARPDPGSGGAGRFSSTTPRHGDGRAPWHGRKGTMRGGARWCDFLQTVFTGMNDSRGP